MQEDAAETASVLRVPGKSMAIGLFLLLGASLRKLEDLGIGFASRERGLISTTEETGVSVKKPRMEWKQKQRKA
jgi:hypothetical protein